MKTEFINVEISLESNLSDCEQFKLVPVDPTNKQLADAAFNLCNEFGVEFVKNNEKFARAVYRELLNSSPLYFGDDPVFNSSAQ